MEKGVMGDTEGHEGERQQKKKVRSLADYISTVGAGCRLAARQIVLGRNIPWRRAVPTDTDTRDIPDYLYLLPE
jgi:hypothetical protein